jgi:uncharacterized protein (DUF1697 family)
MPAYVAFLRAVNVGGANILSMEELRRGCARLGFRDVATYMASGNVLFRADGGAAEVRRRMEAHLASRMGKPMCVLVRTPRQLKGLARGAPFPPAPPDNVRRCVTFLDRPVGGSAPASALGGALAFPARTSREVFSESRPTRGRFPDPNAFLERALRVQATTRNWNVVRRVAEQAREL